MNTVPSFMSPIGSPFANPFATPFSTPFSSPFASSFAGVGTPWSTIASFQGGIPGPIAPAFSGQFGGPFTNPFASSFGLPFAGQFGTPFFGQGPINAWSPSTPITGAPVNPFFNSWSSFGIDGVAPFIGGRFGDVLNQSVLPAWNQFSSINSQWSPLNAGLPTSSIFSGTLPVHGLPFNTFGGTTIPQWSPTSSIFGTPISAVGGVNGFAPFAPITQNIAPVQPTFGSPIYASQTGSPIASSIGSPITGVTPTSNGQGTTTNGVQNSIQNGVASGPFASATPFGFAPITGVVPGQFYNPYLNQLGAQFSGQVPGQFQNQFQGQFPAAQPFAGYQGQAVTNGFGQPLVQPVAQVAGLQPVQTIPGGDLRNASGTTINVSQRDAA
ncbi:MAG: hypothetical protein AAFX79_11790 [Planctomycetota bacterium]